MTQAEVMLEFLRGNPSWTRQLWCDGRLLVYKGQPIARMDRGRPREVDWEGGYDEPPVSGERRVRAMYRRITLRDTTVSQN